MITSKPIGNDRIASMKASSQMFEVNVLPILSERYPGRWISNEGWVTDSERYLDEFAGIDYLYIPESAHVYGVCCRCIKKDGDTFSMRIARDTGTKTELQKRFEERKCGALTPHLCIQVYNSTAGLVIGVCKMYDLIEMIHRKECKVWTCENSTFAFVKFCSMSCAYEIDVYSGNNWLRDKGIKI